MSMIECVSQGVGKERGHMNDPLSTLFSVGLRWKNLSRQAIGVLIYQRCHYLKPAFLPFFQTHSDSGGVVAVFQNKGINYLAANSEKCNKLSFLDAIEPGSIDKSAISGVGFRDLLYMTLCVEKN